MQTKKEFRETILHKRRSLSFNQRQSANQQIMLNVIQRPEIIEANVICSYVSVAEEVDTHGILEKLFELGKTVVVPKVNKGKTVTLYKIPSLKKLTPGSFHILEPEESDQSVQPFDVDAFIVPGVVFDYRGHRIGWGKGYYDKLLTGVTKPRIGLAFACQLVSSIPYSPYDKVMTTIITEKEIIEVGQEEQHGESKKK